MAAVITATIPFFPQTRVPVPHGTNQSKALTVHCWQGRLLVLHGFLTRVFKRQEKKKKGI